MAWGSGAGRGGAGAELWLSHESCLLCVPLHDANDPTPAITLTPTLTRRPILKIELGRKKWMDISLVVSPLVRNCNFGEKNSEPNRRNDEHFAQFWPCFAARRRLLQAGDARATGVARRGRRPPSRLGGARGPCCQRLFVMLCAPKILLYISLYTFLAFTFQLGPGYYFWNVL